MENMEDIEMKENNRDVTDREQEQNEIDGDLSSYFIDTNIRPGTFSFDILSQKFGMNDLDIVSASYKVDDFFNFEKEKFTFLVAKSEAIQEFLVQHVFRSSGYKSDFSLIKPIIDAIKYKILGDGRLSAYVENNETKRNFFIMDNNGEINFYKPDGDQYKIKHKYKTKLSTGLLKQIGLKESFISDLASGDLVATARKITENAKLGIPPSKKEIDELSDRHDDLDDVPKPSKPNEQTEKIVDDGEKPGFSGDNQDKEKESFMDRVKENKDKLTQLIIDKQFALRKKIMTALKRETEKPNFEGNPYKDIIEEIEKDTEELDETLPIKTRLKMLFKEHGVSIATVTMAVGSIITSIAMSMTNNASVMTAVDGSTKKLNNEIKRLRDENERLSKSNNKEINDKIDKNNKEINDKLDKLSGKKTIWDYIKQAASFILSSAGALAKLVGAIIKYVGKAMIGLGWFIYVIIVALVAIMYGYYEK